MLHKKKKNHFDGGLICLFFFFGQNSFLFTDHLCLHVREQDQVVQSFNQFLHIPKQCMETGLLHGGHHAMCAYSCRCCVHLEQRRLCGQEEKER